MLDWKNRTAGARNGAADSVDNVRSYFAGGWAGRAVVGGLGLYLLLTLVVGWYWSQEPAPFSVQQQAEAAGVEDGVGPGDGRRQGGARKSV